MTMHTFFPLLLFLTFLVAIPPLLGSYMVKLFSGNLEIVPPFSWIENGIYRFSRINPRQEMNWITYGKAVLALNVIGFIALFCLELFQGFLPLNPQKFSSLSLDLAFNTAVSFVTNTNWQAYSGETTLSYLTQSLGLTVQNFLSAATGLSVLLALIRGMSRKQSQTIGNFWFDFTRSVLYLLLPLAFIFALILVSQGVVQTFSSYLDVHTLENGSQILPFGPAASQVAIKQLGTNGGGFFGANSAHPYENPTELANFLEMFAIFLIPAASVHAYGEMVGSKRHGWILFLVMLFLFLCGFAVAFMSEQIANPLFPSLHLWEGKEVRIGTLSTAFWTASTTATSNGSVNAMISSLPPLTGGIALFNMMLEELIFGGIGVGLCSFIMFVFLTLFLSGLMVGRTPEYLGKKIERGEIQWVITAILLPSALILIGTAFSCRIPLALASSGNGGPHALSELLYAFSSSASNNGSAFSSLNADTPYYNWILGVVMLLGRISVLLPSLAIAGLLAKKRSAPATAGVLSTDSGIFSVLLLGVILIVGSLTFFPALTLGPVMEHLLMLEGKAF